MPDRPRILVLEGPNHRAGDFVERCQPNWDVVRVEDVDEVSFNKRQERAVGAESNHRDRAQRAVRSADAPPGECVEEQHVALWVARREDPAVRR